MTPASHPWEELRDEFQTLAVAWYLSVMESGRHFPTYR